MGDVNQQNNRKVKRKIRLCCYFDLYPSTCLAWEPYQEYDTPANITIRVTGTQSPHHEKVTARGGTKLEETRKYK